MRAARQEGKMLVIYFRKAEPDSVCAEFERTLSSPEIMGKLESFVRLRLRLDAKVAVNGKDTAILAHASFAEMLGRPGLAMIDLAHEGQPYYGRVVSTFPFDGGRAFSPHQISVMLDLPPGSLTQRTVVYAVRIHPDRPASTGGELDPYLLSEAERHSQHQARIRLQGHHNWESRFHRINRKLPGALQASEVCAESWPGENLVEAAIECVRCWRLSSGHWSAVREHHPVYGYDMKRGSNGVWYATGIFGRRR
jgi:hypothetical protein